MDNGYFRHRNVTPEIYNNFVLPKYLQEILKEEKGSKILDIGCGFGHILSALAKENYTQLYGVDILEEAVEECKNNNLNVEQISNIIDFAANFKGDKFDFIIMSHVIEHIPKSEIIEILLAIKKHLLSQNGKLLILTPNAQSNTGCYWAYEDFTHTTLFTAGSLIYVLRCAGFTEINFIDQYNFSQTNIFISLTRKILLWLYITNKSFWNLVTCSSYHKFSPQIYSYELRVLAN